MRFAVIIEKANGNYSAYVPDLPGCDATGATVEETEKEIREAIRFSHRRTKGGRAAGAGGDEQYCEIANLSAPKPSDVGTMLHCQFGNYR